MAIDDTTSQPSVLSEERNSWLFSFGSYVTLDGCLTSLGFYLDDTGPTEAFGDRGVFMVRDYTVAPIPAAVWLFGSGLLGPVAVARRKS
jgi:hypothetical protein